jgi:DNA-binding SARP family transcriptional activator
MSQLQLSLLGAPIVQHGEHTLTFSTRKALALLVYLAVEGGTHTRKTLSESFWPELDAEHGRAALRATLFELRKLLEGSHASGERAHLQVGRETLGLEQASLPILDLHLVESASKQVGEAGRPGEPLADQAAGELLAHLEQATRLVRGAFLASFTLRDSQFFDDWTRQHREYWYLRIHQLFDALSGLYERAGDWERAIETVSRWLSLDPLAEEGYRRLMRVRFALGDRTGALRAYANCRAVLADELQVEPEPQTVALAKRLRHTTPFRPAPSQPPRLSPGQSPAHLLDGPFLGRTAQFGTLVECYQLVHARQPQFVLLQGEAGIGKTRLASEFLSWAQTQGADVLAGRALQTARPLPYQPLIEVLRPRLEQEHATDDRLSDVWLAELSRLLPELRDRSPELPVPSLDEELGHHHLFEAMARLLRMWAARRPLVLFLDDLHWADPATLDLLLSLARSLAEQPVPILLLLTLRTGAATFSDLQSTWVSALKRTHIPLTALQLAAFTPEETQRFVQALAWAEPKAENNSSTEGGPDTGGSSTDRESLVPLADWLYVQTRGHPFYLVEILKGLLEGEIILPAFQENGTWGLVLRSGLLAQTPRSELIPPSLRELIRSQLCQLIPSAWALLVAGAVLGKGLTFERLCQVARLDEPTGLQALEELLRSGWLCEEKLAQESLGLEGYTFPGEVVRQVVYQEAGATRQRLVQRRVSVVMQEEVEHNQGEKTCLPHPAPSDEHAPAETRKRQGRPVVAGAGSGGMGGMHWAVAKDSSGMTGRHPDNRYRRANPAGSRDTGAAGQAASALPRSPPGTPIR